MHQTDRPGPGESVYLGVGAAAYKEVTRVLKGRVPPGYVQPLAYHPDVRRRVAEMSVDLEAAPVDDISLGLAERYAGADAGGARCDVSR